MTAIRTRLRHFPGSPNLNLVRPARRTALLLFFVLSLTSGTAASAGERTYYNETRMDALKHNLENHDWAVKQRDAILRRADKWLAYEDERLRTLVPPPEVPRAIVAHEKGAPANGDALKRIGAYSWVISFDKPWKVTSPVDGTVYPSNDFAAFLASGFKDRSLLTGPYPDDGWGCYVEGEKRPFWFVAAYAHWSVERMLLPALEDLSRAYLLTDDPRYAHATAVLLWQLAEYYPRYYYEKQSRYGKEVQPSYVGRLLYHTWESNSTAQVVPLAYDAIKPAIARDSVLSDLAGASPKALMTRIEDRVLRTMAKDILGGSGRIQGNYGMHQSALLKIAAVLKNSRKEPSSRQMIDWVLDNPGAGQYTQLGLEDAINNLVHRDGYPFESPSYNIGWLRSINQIVSSMGAEGRRILAMPRFRNLCLWPIRMAVAGEFVPSYGDSNHLFQSLIGWAPEILESAYRHFKDPVFARALRQIKARPRRDLFVPGLDSAEVADVARRVRGPLGVQSQLLPGVGFASLQAGSPRNRTALALFYGYYHGHSHFDRLQLDLYSWRHALTPDFGYPETADSYDPRRFGFLSHTVAHNTVMIDAGRQALSRGRLHVYDPGPFAQLVEVSSESSYPGVAQLYRRTLMLVEVSPTQAYVVDIFRVRGGSQHDWIVHGTEANFASTLPLSSPEEKGTLAGVDVPYGDFYDDSRYDNDNAAHVPYHRYEGSGFQWLTNVQQARLSGDAVGSATWNLSRPEDLFPKRPRKGVALRAHLVGGDETVLVADGIPQRREGWPESVKFLFRRRVGEDLESVFVTVFEPYRDTPFIRSVKALPVDPGRDLPVGLEIDLGGRTHVLLNRMESGSNGGTRLPVGGDVVLDARAAVLERASGSGVTRTYLLDDAGTTGLDLGGGTSPHVDRRVTEVDYGKGTVTLSRPIPQDLTPAGAVAIVERGQYASAISMDRIIDGRTIGIGDDDISEGTVHVIAAKGSHISFQTAFAHFSRPGMTLVNEAGRAVGRLLDIGRNKARLSARNLTLRDFPDLDQDGRRTCRCVVIGPGDTLRIHRSTRTGTAARQ